jgi:lipopolysaccharide cholinephosphotransferase
MAKYKPQLTNKNLSSARGVLFDVTTLLDEKNITYHLEGGTLLGIIRDQDLLPWDYDVDISIPQSFVNELFKLKFALFMRGYRMSIRKSKVSSGPIRKGDYSIKKIKPVRDYYLQWLLPSHSKNFVVLDVFIKTNDTTHTYWQAKSKIMRVDKKFYQSFETVQYLNRTLKVPNLYKDYLTEKYGDWSVPVKDWDCGVNELTIVKT